MKGGLDPRRPVPLYGWRGCCECCPLPVKGRKVSKCTGVPVSLIMRWEWSAFWWMLWFGEVSTWTVVCPWKPLSGALAEWPKVTLKDLWCDLGIWPGSFCGVLASDGLLSQLLNQPSSLCFILTWETGQMFSYCFEYWETEIFDAQPLIIPQSWSTWTLIGTEREVV